MSEHEYYSSPTPKYPSGVYRPPLSRRQRLWRATTTLALAAVAVTGGWYGTATLAQSREFCDQEQQIQRMPDGECIGASNGEFVFDPVYRGVSELIADQNRRAERADTPYATIAVWIPHPEDDDAANTTAELLNQLQGSYVAQRAANDQPDPPIKLLIANSGSGNESWSTLCSELERRKQSDNLVAVTGMGSSYRTTSRAVDCLDEAKIPVVGTVASANGMMDDYPYAYRVAPSNSTEAHAAIEYLREDPDVKTGMKVSSLDPDDTYSQTLSDAFDEFESGDDKLEHNQNFDPTKPGLKAQFDDIADNVCYFRPDVLLYAGRGRDHLRILIDSLSTSNCAAGDYEPRIVTGDDASHLDTIDISNTLLWTGELTVEYAGLIHPKQWELDSPVSEIHARPMEEFKTLYENAFPRPGIRDLINGQAIMAYDAITAPIAVLTTRDPSHNAATVASGLQQIRDCSAIIALSGLVEFTESGDAANKPIPILSIGTQLTRGVEAVAWPKGKPTEPAYKC